MSHPESFAKPDKRSKRPAARKQLRASRFDAPLTLLERFVQGGVLRRREPIDILRFFTWFQSRPASQRLLDQFPATLESVLSQTLFMMLTNRLEDKVVVTLGDHDGLSLVLAYFATPKKIIVIDVDEHTLSWLQGVALKEGLQIITIRHDLRTALSEEVMAESAEASICRTDPPYNCAGMACFAKRAAQILPVDGKLFMCIPTPSNQWAQYVEDHTQHFLNSFGFEGNQHSSFLNLYPQHEGVTSRTWMFQKIHNVEILNEDFRFNIYNHTVAFCDEVKCDSYLACRLDKDRWKNIRTAVLAQVKSTISL